MDGVTELDLLRDFYEKWRSLHSMNKLNFDPQSMQVAAQNLVEASHAIETFHKPIVLNA